MHARRTAVAVGAALLVAAGLSACSASAQVSGSPHPSPSPAQTTSVGDAFAATVVDALSTPDLDPAVAEIIEATAASGAMSFQEYKRGLGSYVDCMASVGVEARMLESSTYGVPTILFGERYLPGIELTDDQYRDLRGACVDKTYLPLALVYQAQSSSIETTNARLDTFRPDLVACLAKYDVTLPDDASYDEIMQAITTVNPGSGVGCDLETGFMESQVFPDDFWD